MGVTAHFFAFDPGAYAVPPTIDGLVERGDLDHELSVTRAAAARLKEIDSWLGDNKRWYDNLDGDFAWARARQHVEEAPRAAIDRWLSHLFWHDDDAGCTCGREPAGVAESMVVYDRALLEHVTSLACSLEPVRAALATEFGDPPRTGGLDRPWIYEFDGFCGLVLEWQQVFERALHAGPDRGLLRWVWY